MVSVNYCEVHFIQTNSGYLYFHWCSDHHSLLKEIVIKSRWVVIEVQDCDKDLRQAVLPLCILCFHIKVVLGPHLCIQDGPRLRVDDPRCRLDQESVNVDGIRTCKLMYMHNHHHHFTHIIIL